MLLTPFAIDCQLWAVGKKALTRDSGLVGCGSDDVAIVSEASQLLVELADIGGSETIFVLLAISQP